MPSDVPSNRQSVNTGLRSNRTTPALKFIRCGRACKPLQTTKGSTAESCPVTSLADELNYFYARIEANNTETRMREPAVWEDCMINLSAADVRPLNRSTFTRPDGLPGRVLRACANQLASVFSDLFKLSLSKYVTPTCFNQTTIVPVPKNTKVT